MAWIRTRSLSLPERTAMLAFAEVINNNTPGRGSQSGTCFRLACL